MDTVDALQLVSSRLQVGEAYAELRRKYVRQIVLNCALKRTATRRLVNIEYFRKEAIDNYRNYVQMRNTAYRFERDFASAFRLAQLRGSTRCSRPRSPDPWDFRVR